MDEEPSMMIPEPEPEPEPVELYADPIQRRVDVKDILTTARTLGLDEKYDIVFRVLHEVAESSGDAVNFE